MVTKPQSLSLHKLSQVNPLSSQFLLPAFSPVQRLRFSCPSLSELLSLKFLLLPALLEHSHHNISNWTPVADTCNPSYLGD
jgi:hypothetical protein